MLQGTEEYGAREVQNAWLWAKVGQFLAGDKIDWAAFRAPALQILDNERIEATYVDVSGRMKLELSPGEFQRELFNLEMAAGSRTVGQYARQDLGGMVERLDRTGVDFLTNHPTYTPSIRPVTPFDYSSQDLLGFREEKPTMVLSPHRPQHQLFYPLPKDIAAVVELFLKELRRE